MTYFGTDGIRQKAEQFTPEFLANLIKGLLDYTGDQIKVLLGGDTRESTEWILANLESALETFGIEYGNVGVLPTPAINYCFYEMGFDIAIDVTASHNPYQDNGIKIFERGAKHGVKLSEAGQAAVEAALQNPEPIELIAATLRESLHEDAAQLYLKHLEQYLGAFSLSGLRIGLDCANGATSAIAQLPFKAAGAEIASINADANYGTKINANCGSTHLEHLQDLVQNQQLSFGVAFDGDGDRVLAIDDQGEIIDGDQIIAIITKYLRLDALVSTVMANQGLLNWAKAEQLNLEIAPVGDTNVAILMREKHIKIGGEQSGHIILPGEATGDGILTALLLAKIVAESKQSLHELAQIITKFPQVNRGITANSTQKQRLTADEAIKDLLLDYAKQLEATSGRLLVRPSGTEELIRITIWGEDEMQINQFADELKQKLEELL